MSPIKKWITQIKHHREPFANLRNPLLTLRDQSVKRVEGFVEDLLDQVRIKASCGECPCRASTLGAAGSGVTEARSYFSGSRLIISRDPKPRDGMVDYLIIKASRCKFEANGRTGISPPCPMISPEACASVVIEKTPGTQRGHSPIGAIGCNSTSAEIGNDVLP